MKRCCSLLAVLFMFFSASAFADVTVLACTGTGTGGDRADLRGIRFAVDESFSVLEVRMEGRVAGRYGFTAELRRSSGFVSRPIRTIRGVSAVLPGNEGTTPYPVVRIEFDEVPVTSSDTFTLKFTSIVGPGILFFETYGIGNEPCRGAEETSQNNVANPTVRGDPAGFKVLAANPQFINSAFDSDPPQIDGVIGFGEWPLSNRIEFDNGYFTVVNDLTRLYILINVTEDTGNDDSDFFWLTFDVNRDKLISPNVDLNYATNPNNGNMRYQYYLGPGSWTGLQPDTFSSKAEGFGCFFADGSRRFSIFPNKPFCRGHRVWELAIDLAEIDAVAGDRIKLGLRVSSPNPSFTDDTPTSFFTNFNRLVEVKLGSSLTIFPLPSNLATVDVEFNALEVTQAVQTRTNQMPLVDDKDTVARAYVDTDGLLPRSQAVIVSLYGSKGDVDLPGSPLARYQIAPVTIDREDINDTADFKLPETWNDGSIDFRVVARKYRASGQDASANIPISFTQKETPTYWIVPINTGTNASPVLPSNTEIASQESYLKTVFPVPDVKFVRKPWQVLGPTSVGNTISDLNQYHSQVVLSWILGLIFTGNPPFDLPDQIYGFTPSGGGISDPIWFGGNGFVARGFRGTSREATMAHEINHNLDRDPTGTWGRHAPFGCGAGGPDSAWPFGNDDIQQVGFDPRLPWVSGTGSRDTVIPSNYPDYMSYCQSDDLAGNPSGQLPTKWISTYRWQNLFNNFSTFLAASAKFEAAALAQAQIEETLYISGQLNIAGTGELNPVVMQPGMPTDPIREGKYMVELLDVTGRPILQQPFFVSFVDVEGVRHEVVPFSFVLPTPKLPVGTVVLKLGEEVLDTIRVTQNAPVINVVSPNGGEQWRGMQTIKWEARDEDLAPLGLNSDPLSFNILYTPDDGVTWFPVAAGVQGSSLDVDASNLPGGQDARIRVIATDGFNTAEDDSDGTFVVLQNPPQVTIDMPGDNSIFPAGTTVRFMGTATDTEDEVLPDDSQAWAHGETLFGTGPVVDAALPVGKHTVSFTAVDSTGDSSSDTIEVEFAELCDGDFDSDGDVDGSDLSVFSGEFGQTACPKCQADFDGDNDVDGTDLSTFSQSFGRTNCPVIVDDAR